jgi:D-alanyl-D-alanine carboxypeptidase
MRASGGAEDAMRLTRRGRWVAAVLAAGVIATSAFVLRSALQHDLLTRPDTICESPPLRTFRGVTLQPVALMAFKKAQRLAGGAIEVVQSYRSCAEQAKACRNICGDPDGCPGRCAPPGFSYHQLGAAIDITQASLDTPGVMRALERAGWCQSQPSSDPGHFSFDGCH